MALLEGALDFASDGIPSAARGRRIVNVSELSGLSSGRFVARLRGPEELTAVQTFNARRDIPGKVEALHVPFTAEPEAYSSWGYWVFFEPGTELPEGRECWGFLGGNDVYKFLSSHPRRPFTLTGENPAALALASAFHCTHGVTRLDFEALLQQREFNWSPEQVEWRGLILTLSHIHDFRRKRLRAIAVDRLTDPFQGL